MAEHSGPGCLLVPALADRVPHGHRSGPFGPDPADGLGRVSRPDYASADACPRPPFRAAYTAERSRRPSRAFPAAPSTTGAVVELLTPSVSALRVKRWSYADVLALRLIDWLRRDKVDLEISRSPMRKIREALAAVEGLGDRLLTDGAKASVDHRGGIVLRVREEIFVPLPRGVDQLAVDDQTDLVAAGPESAGLTRVSLARPRQTLRIIPGKLSSEPHVDGTRIETLLDRRLEPPRFRARRASAS